MFPTLIFLPRLLTTPVCPLQFGRSLACKACLQAEGILELPFYFSSPSLPAPKEGLSANQKSPERNNKVRRKPNWDLIVSQAFGRALLSELLKKSLLYFLLHLRACPLKICSRLAFFLAALFRSHSTALHLLVCSQKGPQESEQSGEGSTVVSGKTPLPLA